MCSKFCIKEWCMPGPAWFPACTPFLLAPHSFPRAGTVLFQFPEPTLTWGQMCSDNSNSTFCCQSNPDPLPKSSWLGFCLLSYLIPCPTDLLSTLPWLPCHSATRSDRKPTALSPWPCYKSFLVHHVFFKGYTYITHPVLSYADLSGSFLGTLRIKTESESGKSQVTSDNAQMRSPQLFLFLKDCSVVTFPETRLFSSVFYVSFHNKSHFC